MAQQPITDYPIDPITTSGTELADILNRTNQSLNSTNSGPNRPPAIQAGGLWVKTGGTKLELFMYDGTTDIQIQSGSFAVSADTGNITVLGSDSLAFTPAPQVRTNVDDPANPFPEWYDPTTDTWLPFPEGDSLFGPANARVLLIGGGGGGGGSVASGNGGGAAGEVFDDFIELKSGTTFEIFIGAGGSANANGGTSYIRVVGDSTDIATAIGGGAGGGGSYVAGKDGASGGGGSSGQNDGGSWTAGGAAIPGANGFPGGRGSNALYGGAGGGGGSGGPGQDSGGSYLGGNGGTGFVSDITGSRIAYAGGGGGGGSQSRGEAGGGRGGLVGEAISAPFNARANSGSGGGASYAVGDAGKGGSGFFAVRYKGPAATGGVHSMSPDGQWNINVFTASGTLVMP